MFVNLSESLLGEVSSCVGSNDCFSKPATAGETLEGAGAGTGVDTSAGTSVETELDTGKGTTAEVREEVAGVSVFVVVTGAGTMVVVAAVGSDTEPAVTVDWVVAGTDSVKEVIDTVTDFAEAVVVTVTIFAVAGTGVELVTGLVGVDGIVLVGAGVVTLTDFAGAEVVVTVFAEAVVDTGTVFAVDGTGVEVVIG